MTRLKPRKRDKIIAGFSEIDRKFNTTREEPKNTTIKELEDQMNNGTIDVNKNLGMSSHKNLNKKMRKSHKDLR